MNSLVAMPGAVESAVIPVLPAQVPDAAAPRMHDPVTDSTVKATGGARAVDPEDRSWFKVPLATAIGIAATFALGRSGWFSARDDTGYYIGLVGGILMLLLLAYPLRKHLASFRNLGPTKYWFTVHMVLGIGGPMLILLHSTFRLGSTNSAVALVCMLIVAGSGIVGRYLYTRMHRGLFGEKLNLLELQAINGLDNEHLATALHDAPEVQARLQRYEAYALQPFGHDLQDAWRFITLGRHRVITHQGCMLEIEQVLQHESADMALDAADIAERMRAADELVNSVLSSAQRIAQFTVYDRLLRLWHIAHVPLVYLLVVTSVAHVVAVHMY